MEYLIDFLSKPFGSIERGAQRAMLTEAERQAFADLFSGDVEGVHVKWNEGETKPVFSKPLDRPILQTVETDVDGETFEEQVIVMPEVSVNLKKGKTLSSLETIINDILYFDPKLQAKEFIRIQIDRFRGQLLGKYTETEQRGWVLFLPEAKAYLASENPGDAPGLSLQAAIEQTPLKDVAKGIIAAAGVTGMLPHLAAGVRSKANELIDATDGSPEAIKAVTDLLTAKQTAIAIAIQSGDQAAVLEAATSGWG